ncbi:uncharacterized protein DS421_13g404350 [Arachis hypogaea]|nr:uncharacterized protein DS421_13g404350 [Arachis hypogaea]
MMVVKRDLMHHQKIDDQAVDFIILFLIIFFKILTASRRKISMEEIAVYFFASINTFFLVVDLWGLVHVNLSLNRFKDGFPSALQNLCNSGSSIYPPLNAGMT